MWYEIIVIIILMIIIYTIDAYTSRVRETLASPNPLDPYLGSWIWFSDDGLRKEIITINYAGDNRFVNITRKTTIKKWFPPVHKGDLALVAPPIITVDQAPMYRVINLSRDEIMVKSIEPTWSELPYRIKLVDKYFIEVYGKKYISVDRLTPIL